MRRWRRLPLLAVFPLMMASARAGEAAGERPEVNAPRGIALAVIVNPKNPVEKVSFSELRSYLRMERQFWPGRKRCLIFLPPGKSVAHAILLRKVYRMSARKLKRYWVRKLFSGEIPEKPSYVPSVRAARSRVLKEVGALSVVAAHEVPAGVKVLRIDGKLPGEKGYPLVGKRETASP